MQINKLNEWIPKESFTQIYNNCITTRIPHFRMECQQPGTFFFPHMVYWGREEHSHTNHACGVPNCAQGRELRKWVWHRKQFADSTNLIRELTSALVFLTNQMLPHIHTLPRKVSKSAPVWVQMQCHEIKLAIKAATQKRKKEKKIKSSCPSNMAVEIQD